MGAFAFYLYDKPHKYNLNTHFLIQLWYKEKEHFKFWTLQRLNGNTVDLRSLSCKYLQNNFLMPGGYKSINKSLFVRTFCLFLRIKCPENI